MQSDRGSPFLLQESLPATAGSAADRLTQIIAASRRQRGRTTMPASVSDEYAFQRHEGPYDIFLISDLQVRGILERTRLFWASIQRVYVNEKRSFGSVVDFATASDIERMCFHINVHAITGLVEWGTSSTFSIPYWDIQGVGMGLKRLMREQEAMLLLQDTYHASTAALIRYLVILGHLTDTFKAFRQNIEAFASLGKVTRSNIRPELGEAHRNWSRLSDRFGIVTQAKFKHLLFLADQIQSESIRRKLSFTIKQLAEIAQIPTGSMTINVGIDGGLIAESYRPAYELFMIKQLRHLGVRSYSASSDQCPTFTWQQILDSIDRKGDSGSELIDPLRDILLPWNFGDAG